MLATAASRSAWDWISAKAGVGIPRSLNMLFSNQRSRAMRKASALG